jgi:hypothetical protein
MISGADVGVEEELSSIGIGPVFWNLELSLSCLDSLDEFLKSTVFTDEFQCGMGADLGNGVEVIAAEEDTEVDELTH